MLRNTKLCFLLGKQSWSFTRSIGSFANQNLYDESVSQICSDYQYNDIGEDIVGIDFGTTNTRVAVGDRVGYKVLTKIPSVLYIEKNDKQIVSKWRDVYDIWYHRNSILDIKRLLSNGIDGIDGDFQGYIQDYMKTVPFKIEYSPGEKDPLISVPVTEKRYKPYEAVAPILNYMKKSAEGHFKKVVCNAVVTVPHTCNYYEDNETYALPFEGYSTKRLYKEAANLAGFKRIDLVKEPIAAVLALDSLDPQKSTSDDKLTAVYDFGGGKFQVSIVKSENGHISFITQCAPLLNGYLIDNILINYLNQKFFEETGIDLRNNETALWQLRGAAVKAKIKLSTEAKVKINIDDLAKTFNGESKGLEMELTRKEFENRIDDLITRTIVLGEDCIKKCAYPWGIEKKDIDEVLLVGGVTKMPKVKAMVEEFFGKAPNSKLDPEEILAIGAAVAARRSKQYFEY